MARVLRSSLTNKNVLEVNQKQNRNSARGYSLLELVITLGVLAILVMGPVPMAQNAVKREKEIKLRETLRMMRSAIDEFKRDTFGACPQGAITSTNATLPGGGWLCLDREFSRSHRHGRAARSLEQSRAEEGGLLMNLRRRLKGAPMFAR